MSSQPQTDVRPAPADDEPDSRVSGSQPMEGATAIDAAGDETVSIELDFNAFADHCPPTQHARRVARVTDPSVQDFADQVLELAALRMELKRLTRECASLRQAVHVRDMRLQTLQGLVRGSRDGIAGESKPPAQPSIVADNASPKDELSHTLDLLLANAPATSAIDDTPTVAIAPKRRLIPVNHAGEPILLSRDIITIGRTKDKDICIPSRAVSRDHARLVMSMRSATLFDMDSANGCFVNDERVRRHKLCENDVLRIGDRSYRFATH